MKHRNAIARLYFYCLSVALYCIVWKRITWLFAVTKQNELHAEHLYFSNLPNNIASVDSTRAKKTRK